MHRHQLLRQLITPYRNIQFYCYLIFFCSGNFFQKMFKGDGRFPSVFVVTKYHTVYRIPYTIYRFLLIIRTVFLNVTVVIILPSTILLSLLFTVSHIIYPSHYFSSSFSSKIITQSRTYVSSSWSASSPLHFYLYFPAHRSLLHLPL